MHLPALFSRKTSPQQYRSGKNLAEHNRTVTKLWQRMRFPAPFGRFYGVFRQNGQQIEAKNAFPRTVRPLLWRFPPERSPNYGKECIFLHRSVASMAFPARTVTKLWQKMHFLAPFGRFYGIFRPNG